MTLTVGSLFSGIGGIDYAFREAGFNILWQVEIDEFCRKVLDKNFPDTFRQSDIYDCHYLPRVDVITAGFPCQPFSVAGRRLGEKDPRYLIPEMFRIIKEVQPSVILFENVPGFASITGGETFKDFLWALTEIGYDAEWSHLRASDAGAPHRRERWFCVAYSDSLRCRSRSGYREERYLLPDQNRNATQDQPERQERISGVSKVSQVTELADTLSPRCEEPIISTIEPQLGQRTGGDATPMGYTERRRFSRNTWRKYGKKSQNRHTWKWRLPQPAICRNAYGLSEGLVQHRFPNTIGEAQHPTEPPYTTKDKSKTRAKEIKALGNAVVPQVIYPIALKIKEYLNESLDVY